MIVVGVDPGARDTGVTVVDYTLITSAMPTLVASYTVRRPKVDGESILDVPVQYLRDVNAAIVTALTDHGAEGLGVEDVKRPSWRVKGKVSPLDPAAIMGTAIVVGAVLGRSWAVPLVRIPPGRNGHLFPLNRYPGGLATAGKGHDKLRHERSAFDVAVTAAPDLARLLNRRERSKPHA